MCSIRPGSACGIYGPIGRCATLQRARRGPALGDHRLSQFRVFDHARTRTRIITLLIIPPTHI
eukprot:4619869-Prymnesium_polylepis.1